MSRWDIERTDHVFENTTWRPGPIIRSRVVNSEAGELSSTEEPDGAGVVVCPTCRGRVPDIAVACPDDGTPFPQPSG